MTNLMRSVSNPRTHVGLQILLWLMISGAEAQTEKPLAAVAPVAILGPISEGQQTILFNTLQDQLEDYYRLIPQKGFLEAQEAAYQIMEEDQCTEDQCIRKIQEILQVEHLFILQIVLEEGDTQLSLTRSDLESKQIETDYCENCKTRVLNDRIKMLVQKLVSSSSIPPPKREIKEPPAQPKPTKETPSHSMQVIAAIQTSLVPLKGGVFRQGDLQKSGQADELPAHSVSLKSFYMSDHEVTAREYHACVSANGCQYGGPSEGERRTYGVLGKENHPMNYVNWDETQAFVHWLNRSSSKTFRLCTEAEWEYAARAGTTSAWPCGNNEKCLAQVAWYNTSLTHEVKTAQANPWGLYDLNGNVWEWVSDWYQQDYYRKLPDQISDPQGPAIGTHRVRRGGFFQNTSEHLRSAKRSYSTPSERNYYLGFRLCAN